MATTTNGDLQGEPIRSPPTDKIDDIRLWAETLPLDNPVITAENIYGYLRNLQDKSFSMEEQFEILDFFEPVLRYLWHALPKFYLGVTNTPYKDKGHIIFLCNGLESSAVNAYAMLITMLTKTAVITRHKSFHALLLYRTLYHLTHILITYYQLSAKPPEMIWKKFHKLYIHAGRYELLTIDVSSDFTAPTTSATIETAYKHALLLSTGDPFKLRFHEIEKFHQALYTWSSMVLLATELEDPLFTVDVNSDFPPRYSAVSLELSKYTLGLDTRILAEHMEDILFNRVDAELTVRILETLSKPLIEHLQKIWCHNYSRKFPRKNAEGEMIACLGMNAVYAMLSGENIFDMVTLPVIEKNIEQQTQITDNYTTTALAAKQNRYAIYQWKISNMAPEGFCLITMGVEKEIIQPTEIVLLKSHANEIDLPWQLGILRWVMREDETDVAKIGVETLSVNARAVIARSEKETTAIHAILFPAYEGSDFNLSIILPPMDYMEGDSLYVSNDHLEYEIKLVHSVVTNVNLSYFQAMIVKAIREDISLSHEATQMQYTGKSIGNIWEDI